MATPFEHVASNIEEACRRGGTSVKHVAPRAGLPIEWLKEVRAGARDPTLGELMALASELAIPVTELVVVPEHRSQARTRANGTSPLAMPVVLVTILNGSRSQETALRFDSRTDSAELGEAIHRPVRAFARKASARWSAPSALVDDYPGRQAQQLMVGTLQRRKARNGAVQFWVTDEDRGLALRRVAEFLLLEKATPVAVALDATATLAAAYEDVAQLLMEAERAYSTLPVREALADEMRDAFEAVGAANPSS